jgi:hypothetical protein
VKPFKGLHSNGMLLALPPNIKLGWKCREVANTLAYYDTATITAVKTFIVQAQHYLYFSNFQPLRQSKQSLKLYVYGQKNEHGP